LIHIKKEYDDAMKKGKKERKEKDKEEKRGR